MGPVFQYRIVNMVYQVCSFWCGAGGDFLDLFYRMHLIAGVDALWAVSGKEVCIQFQTADTLNNW